MHLKVSGTEAMIFEGDIYGFSTTAIDGKITFMDHHANYVTVLKKGEIAIMDKPGEEAKRKITLRENSLLLIEDNKAIVFC
jgi:F0F1-type ATP synthase epsilon subunit